MANNVTAEEALRHSKDTRAMLQNHVEDCAEYRAETRDALGAINKTMVASQAVREERTQEHERRARRNAWLVGVVGLAIAALSAWPAILMIMRG